MSLFPICFHWPFDMHTWISLSKPLWHQHSVNGPIGRQAESTSLPPTLIHEFKWWDAAKAMQSGMDHLEVVHYLNISSQTHRAGTWRNISLKILVNVLYITNIWSSCVKRTKCDKVKVNELEKHISRCFHKFYRKKFDKHLKINKTYKVTVCTPSL